MPLNNKVNKTLSLILSTTTSTIKPTPCELPTFPTKKPNNKSEESSNEKLDETTKKPKSKSSRRRRNVLNSNKRCIGKLFGGFGRDFILGARNPTEEVAEPIVGAAYPSDDSSSSNLQADNPNADDCDRYESDNLGSEKDVGDNLGAESILQAISMKKQLIDGKLPTIDSQKRFDLFKKFTAVSENLIHGKISNSGESLEVGKKGAETSDSAQMESAAAPVVEPFAPPQFSKYEPSSYNPNDYLPSYEYFPQNRPQNSLQPSYPENPSHSIVVGPSSMKSTSYNHQQHDFSVPSISFDQPQLPQNSIPIHEKPFVIGPTSFKSTAIYEHLGSPHEISPTTKRYVDKTSPPGCQCDPEQIDDLLHHMQSSYTQFHNGMIQLFDTFKSQTNCGSNAPRISDSSSSSSQPNLCQDKNVINADPELAKSCRKAFAESNIDLPGGFYELPSLSDIKKGGYQNQFLSYNDYLKMVQNVNSNAGSVLSSSNDLNENIVSKAHIMSDDDSKEKTVNQLRSHFDNYQEPVPEEPQVAAAPETPSNNFKPIKFPFQIKLPQWNPRLKI